MGVQFALEVLFRRVAYTCHSISGVFRWLHEAYNGMRNCSKRHGRKITLLEML